MTAETASKTEATKGKPEPAYRKPNQTRDGRLRQRMVAAYVQALGGSDRVSEIVRRDVVRAVDLEILAATARAAALLGKESLGTAMRVEIQASKAIRRLNLPAPRSKSSLRYGRAEPVETLADYFAGQHGEDE
jgi:hypothetical protein